jgi:hypothetical protein
MHSTNMGSFVKTFNVWNVYARALDVSSVFQDSLYGRMHIHTLQQSAKKYALLIEDVLSGHYYSLAHNEVYTVAATDAPPLVLRALDDGTKGHVLVLVHLIPCAS